ncbi:MAG: DNA alkylation repair protein [Myxococcota bacterium]
MPARRRASPPLSCSPMTGVCVLSPDQSQHVTWWVQAAQLGLQSLANPQKAPEMQAYMKTQMPFYGVPAPERARLLAQLKSAEPIRSPEVYESVVRQLWALPHREEKYMAIAVARSAPNFIKTEALPLYEHMIRSGAWWDFVDELAQHLVGTALAAEPERVYPVLDAWILHDDLWLRRTALLAQNRLRIHTDETRLFRYVLTCAHEKEFFIRKGIGWALREYAYVHPERVESFVHAHQQQLSGLSVREALKNIEKRRHRRASPTPSEPHEIHSSSPDSEEEEDT